VASSACRDDDDGCAGSVSQHRRRSISRWICPKVETRKAARSDAETIDSLVEEYSKLSAEATSEKETADARVRELETLNEELSTKASERAPPRDGRSISPPQRRRRDIKACSPDRASEDGVCPTNHRPPLHDD
jgi:uncharacterized protein with von Willebrand factor type A (vWA) domain